MTQLRWVLLIAALLILVALFVWTRYRSRLVGRFRLPARVAAAKPAAASGGRQEPTLPGRAPVPDGLKAKNLFGAARVRIVAHPQLGLAFGG